MKTLLALLLSAVTLQAAVTTPLYNAVLTGPLAGGSQPINNISTLSFGSGSGSARIHLLPTGTPTTSADGIKIGSDLALYRSASGTLTLSGNLVVTGSVASGSGIVQLAGANVFSGTNTFNGAVTIGSTLTYQSAFAVSDNTVRDGCRSALSLTPGTDVQAYSALLAAIAALNPQSGYIIVGNGSTWVTQNGSTARSSLGLGTGDSVTFTNGTLSGNLSVTGTATIGGKVTLSGATSSANGLQFGSAGVLYGSGSSVVTDNNLVVNGSTTLGNDGSDVLTVSGVLKLGSSNDASLQRTDTSLITATGSLAVTGTLTTGSPLGTTYGGTGLNLSALAAGNLLYTTATGTFGTAPVGSLGLTLLATGSQSDGRTALGLGTVATYAVQSGSTASSSQVVLGSDTRLSDSRTPTGSANGSGSDITGTYPDALTIKPGAVTMGTDTSGSYVSYLSAGTGVTLGGTNNQSAAVPVIAIGQSVATGATPTFAGITLTGSGAFTDGTFSGTMAAATGNVTGTLTANNLTVTGTATYSGSLTFGTITVDTLVLSQASTPTIGKVAGLAMQHELHVAKDNSWDTDTRTSLSPYDVYRPFASISGATSASSSADLVIVHPASSSYATPSEFGADNRAFYLMAGSTIGAVSTANATHYQITGPGAVSGNVTVSNSSAVVKIRSDVTGTVSVSAGELDLYGTTTGDITCSGGVVHLWGVVNGSLTVSGGTVYLHNRLQRSTSGAAVTITSGTLYCDTSAQVAASTNTQTGVSQATGSAWYVSNSMQVYGVLAGTGVSPTVTGMLTYWNVATSSYVTQHGSLASLTVVGALAASSTLDVTGALTAHAAVTTSSSSGGLGYATGAGGAVTQITSSSTGVTLNTATGQVTTVALTTAAGAEEVFTVTNSSVADGDVVSVSPVYAGTGTPGVFTTVTSGGGSFKITITNLHASAAFNAAMRINFVIVKGVAN
jgi:hypothetical protein